MTPRTILALASCGFVVLGIACVDLFHGTDFETLCTRSPHDPACETDGGIAPDVVEATVDAARPHPDFCAWTSPEAQDQAKRACAWLGACEGPLGESAFGPCVVHAQLAYDCDLNPALRPRGSVDAFWACLATVQSCGDVDGCVFPQGLQECNEVEGGTSTACGTSANEVVRLECGGPQGRARGIEPCAMFGKTCLTEVAGIATCTGKLGFACTTSACSGTSAVDCTPAGTKMLNRGLDCAGYGSGQCTEGDAGPFCEPGKATTTCTTDSPPACDGNFLVTTCIAGEKISIDCSRLGLPCDVSQVSPVDPTAACFNRGADSCTAGSDTCQNNVLRSCGRGAYYDIDCASVGLGKCAVSAAGRGACGKPAR